MMSRCRGRARGVSLLLVRLERGEALKDGCVSTMRGIVISDVFESNVRNATVEENMSAETRSNPVEQRFIRNRNILCVSAFVQQ